jgi:hypothetical protein
MRKFRKKVHLIIHFSLLLIIIIANVKVTLIITPYQFGAFLMPLRPLFNQTDIPP